MRRVYTDFRPITDSTNYDYRWVKSYGDISPDAATAIKETFDGKFVVAGFTESFGAQGSDVWILKLMRNGSIQWQKRYGGPGRDIAYDIEQTNDLGFIVVGSTDSFGSASSDVWVLKLDPDGEIEWQKRYGGSHADVAYDIEKTNDGGFIMAGETGSFGASSDGYNNSDVWVLKLDPDGNVQWQKRYGRDRMDRANSIRQTSDGAYVVAGSTQVPTEEDGWYVDNAWVLKLSEEDGEIVWQRVYGSGYYSGLNSVVESSDGNLVVAGWAPMQALVYKIHAADGGMLWRRLYDLPDRAAHHFFSANALQKTRSGYVVAGLSSDYFSHHKFTFEANNSEILVFQIDQDGYPIWHKTYGKLDEPGKSFNTWSMVVDSKGGIAVAGTSFVDDDEVQSAYVLRFRDDIPNCDGLQTWGEMRVIDYGGDEGETLHHVGADTTASANTTHAHPVRTDTTSEVDCYYAVYPPIYVFEGTFCEDPSNADFCSLCESENFASVLSLCEGVGGPAVPDPNTYFRPFSYLDEVLITRSGFSFTKHTNKRKKASHMNELRHAIAPLLTRAGYEGVSQKRLKHIEALFRKAPSEIYYDQARKVALLRELKNANALSPPLLVMLIEALNAAELDVSVPQLASVDINEGEYTATDVQGVAWAAFTDVEKAGRITLRINDDIPAPAPGFIPGWPRASYSFDFGGSLAKDGYVDISFYIGGIHFFRNLSTLHILEWDGKSYTDITTNVDVRRGVISGRTEKLKAYVIMNAMPGRHKSLSNISAK